MNVATHVCIGFDLMGKGEVWIDDVQVFDLHFDLQEQDVLLQKHAPYANFKLQQGRFAECQDYLDGYWPRFLLEFVPQSHAPRVARVPRREPLRNAAPGRQPTPPPETKPSFWNRFVPKWKLPFQE